MISGRAVLRQMLCTTLLSMMTHRRGYKRNCHTSVIRSPSQSSPFSESQKSSRLIRRDSFTLLQQTALRACSFALSTKVAEELNFSDIQGSGAIAEMSGEELEDCVAEALSLVRDSDPKVCITALTKLTSDLQLNPGALGPHLKPALPILIERLGSSISIQAAAIKALLTISREVSAVAVLEKMRPAWSRNSWRLKVGMARCIASVCLELDTKSADREELVYEPLVELLGDLNSHVREAATEVLEQLHGRFSEEVEAFIGSSQEPLAHLQLLRSRLFGLIEQPELSSALEEKEKLGSLELPSSPGPKAASERGGRARAEKLIASLATGVDWSKRCEALAELTQWAEGGLCRVAFFPEILRNLVEALKLQVSDRRSAVSKQACHVVASLAATMGGRFEPQALAFMPELFKVLVISVQVMADAADSCARAVVQHCHSQKLLLLISATACVDRNPKLRLHCASYLLQVLEDWQPREYELALDAVEKALVSACQDALAETRSLARAMFGTFSVKWPLHVRPLLERLQPTAQARMRKAMAEYATQGPNSGELVHRQEAAGAKSPFLGWWPDGSTAGPSQGGYASAVQAEPKQPRRLPSLPTAISPKQGPQGFRRPGSAAKAKRAPMRISLTDVSSLKQPMQRQASLVASLPSDRSELSQADLGRRASEHPALRVSNVAPDLFSPQGRRASAPGSPEMIRLPKKPPQWGASVISTKTYGRTPAQELGSIAAKWPAGRMQSSIPRSASSYSRVSSRQASQASTPQMSRVASNASIAAEEEPPSMAELVLRMKRGLPKWQDKLELLKAVSALTVHDPAALEPVANGDVLADTLTALSGDPHAKVACAAIELIEGVMGAAPRFWNGHRLLQIVPALLMRSADTRDTVKRAAAEVVQQLAEQAGLPALLPGLCRSLHSSKVPKILCATLDCFCGMLLGGESLQAVDASSLRSWKGLLSKLTQDKNSEIRQAAASARALMSSPAAVGELKFEAATFCGRLASCAEDIDIRSSCAGLQSHPLGLSGYQTPASASDSDSSPVRSHPAAFSRDLLSPVQTAFAVDSRDLEACGRLPPSPSIDRSPNHDEVECQEAAAAQQAEGVSRKGDVILEEATVDDICQCSASGRLVEPMRRLPLQGAASFREEQHLELKSGGASRQSSGGWPPQGEGLAGGRVEAEHASVGAAEASGADGYFSADNRPSDASEEAARMQHSLAFEEAEASVEDLAVSVAALGVNARVSQLLQLRLTMQVVTAPCVAAFYPEILAAVSKCLNRSDNSEALATAVLVLRDVLQRGAADADLLLPCLQDLLPGLTNGLLTCCGGASFEVQRMAADTLTALLDSVPAPAGLASLASVLPSTEGSSDAATFILKAVTRLAAAGPAADIEQVAYDSTLIEGLAALSHHQNAHVRRCVVECFVALNSAVGGSFLDRIQALLDTTQFKLVCIFAASRR